MAISVSLDTIVQRGASEIQKAHAANILRAGEVMLAAARRTSPVDTGRLRSSIELRHLPEGYGIISTVPYARYQLRPFREGYAAGVEYLRKHGYR